ncbi:MAG: DUF1156 domain-containing protein [Bacteroidales bacterium]
MPTPKKLIEVAMPVKEISAESVRDKSIRHGHISTLHLWWARRPLPVCRAVVFASLVPDPLDENCPQQFKDAIEILLGKTNNLGDPYKPYDDIPWTSVIDPMEDNLRNRLQMFIGKFTLDMQQHLKNNSKKPDAGKMLSDYSLIKWDNKNNEFIIGKARKLIWVAHNAPQDLTKDAKQLLSDFDKHYAAIKDAENVLYITPDRHIQSEEILIKEGDLNFAIEAFLEKMPKVFDPFAGGGAIPLEAARLGCHSYGNDINPVAHIIQKGSLEFPQKYGKPITYSKAEFIQHYGENIWNQQPPEKKVIVNGNAIAVNIDNRLSFDVDFYAKKLLSITEKEIGHLYPADDKGNKPVAYYWARVGVCRNPSCRAEVPLLRSFSLCNKKDKKVSLNPKIADNVIEFEIINKAITINGYNSRGNLKCPCCSSITDVKQIKELYPTGEFKLRLLAIISEGPTGKTYKIPTKEEIAFLTQELPYTDIPSESMQRNSAGGDLFGWGINKWGQIFSPRQLTSLNTLKESFEILKLNNLSTNSYHQSILTYLAILIDRIAAMSTSFGLWKDNLEAIVTPFSRQAIPIVFDFPEVNIFSNSTGSSLNQLDWIIRYIESESKNQFHSILKNASSGEKNQFGEKTLTAVITDPPYYDAIAYADISDFFYVWLKRTIADLYPLNFSTPQTPKSDECTALKHHHNGSIEKAKEHFENKLLEIFDAIEHQTSDIVSIMFAHQSTEAWTTLCNSILGSRMNITGSWAIDSEREVRGVALAGAALQSSVTVSCIPTKSEGFGDYKTVKKAIEKNVAKEVEDLYCLGFRGTDLLTACFGQAVSEFGKYDKVEKADGSEVTVAELLEMARESAFNALLKGFEGDEFTKFYIAWLQLYGLTESNFDDVNRLVKIGLSIETNDIFHENLLIRNGNKQTLGNFEQRFMLNSNLGIKANSLLIDQVHRAMYLYKGTNRAELLKYISEKAATSESNFWRVLTSLDELLPKGSSDQEQTKGLLTNKDSLIRESKDKIQIIPEQAELEF